MESHVVAVLDVYAPEVRGEIAAAAPAELELRFADSYDAAAQAALIAEATVALAGWAEISAALIAAAPRLRMVQKWGIGVDRIDVAALRDAGIPLAITAGANAGPVAEHAVMLMLAVLRRVTEVDAALRRGVWLKAQMRALGLQLTGKTVGLVGFGNIGQKVAKKLQGFETRTIYYDPVPRDAATEESLRASRRPLDALLGESDVISLHAPATADNHHLIGEAALARVKPTAILVNTARGELVDEDALYRALSGGRLLGAGLDAFQEEPPPAGHPLLSLPNVVLTPHTAGAVFDNVGNTARHALGNIQRYLRGEALPAADVVVAPR